MPDSTIDSNQHLAERARLDYPILQPDGQGRQLVYLDSAATALKPQCVVDAVVEVLTHKTANVHRSVHYLGDLATEAFESSRQMVADFIAAEAHEIVFVRNTTEALNLVASGWKESGFRVVSLGDHHSNILPWHEQVRRLPPKESGELDDIALRRELERGDVRLVSVCHISNVLGCSNDIAALARMCHEHGALLVVDAAQSIPHQALDVFELDCDFLAFSGHKLGAPTGVGVLFGKAEHLDQIAWYQHGGSTVEQVHAERVDPKAAPWRFEAGTPAVESVVGLAAAIAYLNSLGMDRIAAHQRQLTQYALQQIEARLPSMTVLGPKQASRSGPISMVQRAVSPHLIARGLSDGYGVCARSGFHCAQPLHEALGVPASLRLSLYLYNTTAEIDLTIDAIGKLIAMNS